MKQLGSNGRTWLKSIHAVFAAIWTGAGLCIIFLLLTSNPGNGDELYGINNSMKMIDDFIVIPCAIGSLITGLLISLMTRWGFFKYHWVTVKWVVTVAAVLSGTFLLGPSLNALEAISETNRLTALADPTYLSTRQVYMIIGGMQPIALTFLIILSYFKPWMKKRQ